MKKSLILVGLLALTMGAAIANEVPCPQAEGKFPPPHHGKFQPPPPNFKNMEERKANFEEKLKLTDEQKAQAKEIHKKGFEEMKPIMEQMKTKHQEIEAVKNSKLLEADKMAKIDEIKAELKLLKKEAKDIRVKNMKEFESILTDKQKKTLEKMKKEGRENMKKQKQKCKCKCDCNRPYPQPKMDKQ